jgi:hypothetical protein
MNDIKKAGHFFKQSSQDNGHSKLAVGATQTHYKDVLIQAPPRFFFFHSLGC